MNDAAHSDVVGRVWAAHRTWSETANRLKQRIARARVAGLWLAIVAAVAAVAAVQVGDEVSWLTRVLSAVAAISAGLGTGIIRSRTSTTSIRNWTRARSASEGLKSEVYQRLAGSTAYLGSDPDRRLTDAAKEILDDVGDLKGLALTVAGDGEAPPAVSGVDSYIELRVDDQIDGYYRPRARTYQQRVSWLRGIGDVLGVIAVVLGGIAAATEVTEMTAWVPVVTTIIAALLAHLAASRYDHLIIEFTRTADELAHLRDTRRDTATSAAFIDACERTISVENQAWMARWNTPAETGD